MAINPWLSAVFCALPLAVQAGIPISTTLTCPIGNEPFEITETMSCSEHGERTMSFAPTSSCDFVTRMPQCPQNHLPMYKQFSEEEISILRELMVSETYDSMVDASRYYIAYVIELQLGNEGPSAPFWLLLQGLWYDPENTFSDSDYLREFLMVSVGEIARESDENRPYVQSMAAFSQMKSGDFEAARALMEAAAVAEIPFLQAYHKAIEACMADANSAFCNPQTLIPQD